MQLEATCINNTLSIRRVYDSPGPPVIVYKVIFIKQQKEVLGGLRQEKGLHAILQTVVTHITDLWTIEQVY